MSNLFFYFLFSFMLIIILMMLNIFFSIDKYLDREKIIPFECGFNMSSHSRLPFTTNYFIITLLFLIFDIEIMLIIPSMFMIKSFNSMYMSITLLFFMILLVISLSYEWMFSMLNWIF
uniref:NADH-ubiquinone oxidoreductase chain 3 n=1 Tax=Megachile strupigera TaxID=1735309 RepID=A0A0P0IGR3_9HYME|nr:NADH dehydrogenase subunit 3 [Megachile strupigera]